ncbi:MAG: tetraacyldisaccharide 4'-kinase [Rikenellaceae bacterium]|jgi:tetraacyldisaccharide 4'-kinase|nr:tetraacyldisaccharide 4'-kinase [Rikenellaceae bacterium]
MNRFYLAPLSMLYGLAIRVRHALFDWKILRSREYGIPVVCVGNITVGGTGKTPVCEYIIDLLSKEYAVALLSRGYGRRTKGYLEVRAEASYRDTGDEPKQIKLKFPNVVVAVCEDRREGIRRIREEHPQVNLIVLDDGFQHRRVEAWANVVLMDWTRPIYHDHLLPWGNLRDVTSQLHRANFVIVTKCPIEYTPLELRIIKKHLALFPYQSIHFTTMIDGEPVALFRETVPQLLPKGGDVIALAGIGNPKPFVAHLKKRYNVVDKLLFEDHHPYRRSDLERMRQAVAKAGGVAAIVTTEKDAVKLINRRKIPDDIAGRLYYMPVNVSFLDRHDEVNFITKLKQYVRENQKHGLIHS